MRPGAGDRSHRHLQRHRLTPAPAVSTGANPFAIGIGANTLITFLPHAGDRHFAGNVDYVRVFAVKTELLTPGGSHLRFVPAAMARAMVNAGNAVVANANGRVKSVCLVTAVSFAPMIGPPSDGWLAPQFSVREKLNCGAVVWKHQD